MKFIYMTLITLIPVSWKHVVLLFMVILISFSPVICMAFEMFDAHVKVYEIVDEDDSKENIVFSHDEEISNQLRFSIQKQLSPNPGILSTDFKPEVPFPPPKSC